MRFLMHKLILLLLFSLTFQAADIKGWLDSESDNFKETESGITLKAGPISELFEEEPILSCNRDETSQVLKCLGSTEGIFSIPEFLEQALNAEDGQKFQINTIINNINFVNEFVVQDSRVQYVIRSADETTYSSIPISNLENISNLQQFERLFADFVEYRYILSENSLEIGNFYLNGEFLTIRDGIRFQGKESFEGIFDDYGDALLGTYLFANGEKYIGNFMSGSRTGYGEYYYNGGNVYKGQHHKNMPHGYGVFYFSQGDTYTGEFQYGKLTGTAIYTSPNTTDVFHGEFFDSRPVSGTEYDADGRPIYIGEYSLKPDHFFIRHGKGKSFVYDKDNFVAIYEGPFKNGLKGDGEGTYSVNGVLWNGDFLDGEFIKGKNIGPDYYFEGTFKDFQILEGKYVTEEWEYHGKWKNGKYEGKAKLVSKNPDGSISLEEYVEFKDGVYVGEIESDPMLFKIKRQERFALIIGNSDYSSSYGYANLANPINDAELMKIKLEDAGFEVTMLTDVNQTNFIESINTFEDQINNSGDGAVGLFYYSGHGLQVDGVNYLVPTDAQIENEYDLEAENISTRRLMKAFEKNLSGTNIIVLDACRNNPFERTFKRSGSSGLVAMDAPTGTYIAYSTAPGKLAADGVGNNSLFTQSLANNILKERLSIEDVFKNTRRDVANQTNNKQVPWSSSSLIGDFYFIP